jgi:hypothetical protein
LLGFLPRFLFSATEPIGYIVKAWLLVLLPTLALAAAVTYLIGDPAARPVELPEPMFILLVVGVAPFLETLLMLPPLWLLSRFAGPEWAVVGSALLWAGAHSLAEPVWGLVVWWAFLVLSAALLTWRERGLWIAVLLVTAIHTLQNIVAAALSLAPGLS